MARAELTAALSIVMRAVPVTGPPPTGPGSWERGRGTEARHGQAGARGAARAPAGRRAGARPDPEGAALHDGPGAPRHPERTLPVRRRRAVPSGRPPAGQRSLVGPVLPRARA